MGALHPDEARRRFAAARVARLATTGPFLVPVCFAAEGDRVWTAVDDVKPKRGGRLRRLRDIDADARVALLVDHYEDEDWARLWWVRAEGTARVHAPGSPAAAHAVALVAARYRQYAAAPPPGPVIEVAVTRWAGWSAA
jgi:PPOX class probable F420-dependent enzyme